MARLPRFVITGQPQHIIQRGNNHPDIFRSDEDYRFYLEKLSDAATKHECDIHAYVLMTNHVHLLVTPHKEDGIGKMMQMLGRYYVQYFNHCFKRTGTLWESRVSKQTDRPVQSRGHGGDRKSDVYRRNQRV